jgi:hypothetical protein
MTNLPRLSSVIRQCVHEDNYPAIFVSKDYSITVGAKAIPIKRGQYQVSSRPIPVKIQEHTSLALSKMVKLPEKHSSSPSFSGSTCSTIMSSPPSSTSQPAVNSPSTNTPTSTVTPSSTRTNLGTELRFQAIANQLASLSQRIDSIENLCLQLKGNTHTVSHQLQQLSTNLTAASSQVYSSLEQQLNATPKPKPQTNKKPPSVSNLMLNLLNKPVITTKKTSSKPPYRITKKASHSHIDPHPLIPSPTTFSNNVNPI